MGKQRHSFKIEPLDRQYLRPLGDLNSRAYLAPLESSQRQSDRIKEAREAYEKHIGQKPIVPGIVNARDVMDAHDKQKTINPGVGMPQSLYLDDFANEVWHAFGTNPYLVGSALYGKDWRDIDVRLILADAEYEALLGPNANPLTEHRNGKWVALCKAFSALGEKMTGLPIDFQIQRNSEANNLYPNPRSALGIIPLRMSK